MEKRQPQHESAPPYPATPMTGSDVMLPAGFYPQDGYSPGPPPPAGYHGGPPPAVYVQPNVFTAPTPYAAYSAGVLSAPGQAGPVTIVTQVVSARTLQEMQGPIVCQHCHQTVEPQTKHSSGILTWTVCAVLIIFGCFLCCFLPFFFDTCKDVEHRCPSCNKVICTYSRQINGVYVRQMAV